MTGHIGNRIKLLRLALPMNQREFAQLIGISQPTLSCYEKGTALPSVEVLIGIASRFGVSLDWLCGISSAQTTVSTLRDFIQVLFELDKSSNLRYEIEVDDHLPNDMETDARKWQTSIKFFGNDPSYPCNAEVCTFLSAFKENRQAFETYLTSKDQYDWWQKYMLDRYGNAFITKKQYEDIPPDRRIALRNALAFEQTQSADE